MSSSRHTQPLQYFLFSQYLADGIRVTLEIIFPVLLFIWLNDLPTGLLIATGAFCISICDMPGPVINKRNGMLYATGFNFIVVLLTSLMNQHPVGMGLLIAGCCFFFTLIGVFGLRAAAVGTSALLMMILRMKAETDWQHTWHDALLILIGSIWYLSAAMLFNQLAPHRPAQRALAECLHETARYLELKASMYETHQEIDEIQKQVITQQVSVHEKQDITRELIFKNRKSDREPSKQGRKLVLSFIQTIDLFEQLSATSYDYREIRQQFQHSGLLPEIAATIRHLSAGIDSIGLAVQSNRFIEKKIEWLPVLDALKQKIDAYDPAKKQLVLRKILINLRNIGEMTEELASYFHPQSKQPVQTDRLDYSQFVSHQDIRPSLLIDNLSLSSASFRHALRMTITCLAGYAISQLISVGEHGYWIVLTVIIILKPGFSLTKQRNTERILGTVGGALLAILILTLTNDKTILFTLVVFFMIGTYTFQRLQYLVMVVFITPYLLIMLHLLGMGFMNLIQERLLDTGIAFVLAFLANYFLFPNWESTQLKELIREVIRANRAYLNAAYQYRNGHTLPVLEYKLIRKQVYVSTTNLSAAFNRMLSEPANQQLNQQDVYQMVVMNQVLSSNIAGLMSDQQMAASDKLAGMLKRSLLTLDDSLQLFDSSNLAVNFISNRTITNPSVLSGTDRISVNQVEYINKLCNDIYKSAMKLHK
jgi:uncharacterized membrane protein (TIGR01666 family)